VLGDADGLVVVPRAEAAGVAERARERVEAEQAYLERIRAGETTRRIYGF
jgi:4-hydroxy-4-methyl-2-oxoglutarate aldolase